MPWVGHVVFLCARYLFSRNAVYFLEGFLDAAQSVVLREFRPLKVGGVPTLWVAVQVIWLDVARQ